MTQLRGEVTELVADGLPPIVRFVVVDAAGRRHEIVEKLAILSTAEQLPAADASIACLVRAVTLDPSGRRIVTVDIACPWSCETVEGRTILDVPEPQLLASDEPWIAVDGRRVPAATVGTNDGLNYGRFFDHPTVEYQAVLPIACLDGYAAEFAALVDELREDDQLDDQPSPFARLGYVRTLAEAAEHPAELADALHGYCDRELLGHHFPFAAATSELIINSTDAIFVVAGQIVICGRCWRRPSS